MLLSKRRTLYPLHNFAFPFSEFPHISVHTYKQLFHIVISLVTRESITFLSR
nr:MAG TPA: hypothetical protein [Caudoviricetes sp.]